MRDMGGAACVTALETAFEEAGRKAEVRLLEPDDLDGALTRAGKRPKKGQAVIVGGGDGTVSAAAARLAGSKAVFGVLPLGTMNLFARSLGMPLVLEEAVAALSAGVVHPVDVGEVNGRIFVHHVSLGFHPRLLLLRERFGYSSRLQKMAMGSYAFARVIGRLRDLHVVAKSNGAAREYTTPVLVISNNPFAERPGGLPAADTPDRGRLALYAARGQGAAGVARAMVASALGNWEDNDAFDTFTARHMTISARRKLVNGSIDGEVERIEMPLEFKIHPHALNVLVPQRE